MDFEKSSIFKRALKTVLRRQLNNLLSQFKEAGEEVAVMSANIQDRTCYHFGSPAGEGFISDQHQLTSSFLDYCVKINEDKEKPILIKLRKDEISGMSKDKLKAYMLNIFETVKAKNENATACAQTPQQTPVKVKRMNDNQPVTSVRQTRSGRKVNIPEKMKDAMSVSREPTMDVSGQTAKKVFVKEPGPFTFTEISCPEPVSEPMDSKTFEKTEVFNVGGDSEAEPDCKPYVDDEDDVDEEHVVSDVVELDGEYFPNLDKALQRRKERAALKLRRKRVKKNLPMAQCETCGISLKDHKCLKLHVKRVHQKVRNAVCSVCAKRFWAQRDVEDHKLSVHTRQCSSCQEYVVEQEPWTEGMTMNIERRVVCACGSLVSIVSKKGAPKSNYACGTCGKLFQNKVHCEVHAKLHGTETTCVCEVCGNSLSSVQSLRNHLKKVHGIEISPCKYCKKNFNNERALMVHISKNHEEENLADVRNSEVQQETSATSSVIVQPSQMFDDY